MHVRYQRALTCQGEERDIENERERENNLGSPPRTCWSSSNPSYPRPPARLFLSLSLCFSLSLSLSSMLCPDTSSFLPLLALSLSHSFLSLCLPYSHKTLTRVCA